MAFKLYIFQLNIFNFILYQVYQQPRFLKSCCKTKSNTLSLIHKQKYSSFIFIMWKQNLLFTIRYQQFSTKNI